MTNVVHNDIENTGPLFFSVVIPLYNKESFVRKTIESVLSQSYPHFELIIVDDGSADDSLQVVRSFQDERIRIIEQENAGVSATRNRGIRAAQYELVALLDADDWWDPDYLKKLELLVDKYPEAVMYGLPHARVKNGRIETFFTFLDEGVEDACFDMVNFSNQQKKWLLPINSSNVTIRKSVLEKSGYFDERLSFYEDYDLFIRIAVFGKLAYPGCGPMSYYYHDVPQDARGSGRQPVLEKHMFGHLAKYDVFYEVCPQLKQYIDRLVLANLRVFVEKKYWDDDCLRGILNKVDPLAYSNVDKVYFSFSVIGRVFIRLNVFRRSAFRVIGRFLGR